MEIYHTIYKGGDGEIVEKKSRFIAEVHPVTSEEEAMEILEKTRKQYWDARHHCWAYIIGRNPAAERMSDDGEPAGTAGKPIPGSDPGQKADGCTCYRDEIFWRNTAWNRWTGQGLYGSNDRRIEEQ